MSDPARHNVPALLVHGEWVRTLARRLVRDPDVAEDLAQETLVVALEHPPRHAQNLRGWLARVLDNLVHQRARRSQWSEAALEAEEQAGPSPATYEVVARAEAQHLVVEEVLALDEPYRSTVLLRYFDELGPREIAKREGVPVATVTSRLTRAHAMLRERLDRRSGCDGQTWMAALSPLLARRGPLSAAASGSILVSTQLKALFVLAALALCGLFAVSVFNVESVEQESVVAVDGGSQDDDSPVVPLDAVEAAGRVGIAQAEEPAPTTAPAGPSLTGRVYMPSGQPAAGAVVVLGDALQLRFLDLGEEADEKTTWTETDEDGNFAFMELPTGTVRFTAGSTQAAPSETLTWELERLPEPMELSLHLRVGIRIFGEVVRKDGSLARDRKVRLLKEATSTETSGLRLMRNVLTDEHGRFDEGHLHPGSWGLVSFPSDEELLDLGGTMPEHMVQATVELDDGEEQYVVLGARSSSAVTVTGQLDDGHAAVQGMLQWIAECEDPMGSQVIAEADAEGRYTIELPTPGTWYVRVIAPTAHTEHYVDVPAVDAYEQDFPVPSATLRGHVFDSDAAPVSNAIVTHMIHEGAPYRLGLSVAKDRVQTEEDGSFQFTGVAPGTYQVGVVHKELGVSRVALVSVEEREAVEGLEFLLQAGEALEGVVLGTDGLPVAGAPLWIHDDSGLVINPVTGVRSNKAGRFKTPPLPDGQYSVVCQVGVLVGFARDLWPGSEGSRDLELRLEPGAALKVSLRSGEHALRGQVRVVDSEGRVFSGLRNGSDPWSWKRYPFDSKLRWVGPLPGGDFVVRVHVPGRVDSVREVSVAPGETLEVVLGD